MIQTSSIVVVHTDWAHRIYNGITGLGLLFTYFPHAHVRAEGLSWQAVVKRIDFVGGGLSITGLVLLSVCTISHRSHHETNRLTASSRYKPVATPTHGYLPTSSAHY
jgi:hypothetical protein